jgi:hypothetical protein
MREPDYVYTNICFGLGLHQNRFKVDLGASLGQENGSGNKLKVGKVMVTLSYMVE